MAPASLFFAWLLVTLWTVTWAEYLEPEEDGELAPAMNSTHGFILNLRFYVLMLSMARIEIIISYLSFPGGVGI